MQFVPYKVAVYKLISNNVYILYFLCVDHHYTCMTTLYYYFLSKKDCPLIFFIYPTEFIISIYFSVQSQCKYLICDKLSVNKTRKSLS